MATRTPKGFGQYIYPDSTDSADPFSGTDNVRFEYNRQGQITKRTDQAGTVHEYVYDKLGREIEDRASSLGSGIDSSVRRIEHTFKSSGELEKVTSYDAATSGQTVKNVINEVTHQPIEGAVSCSCRGNISITPESDAASTIDEIERGQGEVESSYSSTVSGRNATVSFSASATYTPTEGVVLSVSRAPTLSWKCEKKLEDDE